MTREEPIDGDSDSLSPFSVLRVGVHEGWAVPPDAAVVRDIVHLATETGATRFIKEQRDCLVLGILNQYRYWTGSRARLLAVEILRRHTATFEET